MAYGMGITAGDLDRGYNLLPSGAELMSQGPGSMDIDPMAMSAMGGGQGGMGMLPSMGGQGEGAGFLGELQKMKDQPQEDVSWMEQDEEFKNQEKQQQFQAMMMQFQGAADQQQQAGGFTPPYASPGFPQDPQQGLPGRGAQNLQVGERFIPPWQRRGTRYHDLTGERERRVIEWEESVGMGPSSAGPGGGYARPAVAHSFPDLDDEIRTLEGETPVWGGYYGQPYVSPEGEEWFSPPAEPHETFRGGQGVQDYDYLSPEMNLRSQDPALYELGGGFGGGGFGGGLFGGF